MVTFLGVGSAACQSAPVPVVHVNLGARPEQRRSFQPKSSLAEYVDLPGNGAELRVLLSSHELSCDSPINLSDDQILVVLTFAVSNGQKLGKASYVWSAPVEGEKSQPTAQTPLAGTVMPYVRLGKHGYVIPPGGQAEITDISLDPQGAVRGLLRLEQPGAVGVSATSILGSFSARWCRVATINSSE
jgi:hypothetical protein